MPKTIEGDANVQLEKMIKSWSELKNKSKRMTTTQIADESAFEEKLDNLLTLLRQKKITYSWLISMVKKKDKWLE